MRLIHQYSSLALAQTWLDKRAGVGGGVANHVCVHAELHAIWDDEEFPDGVVAVAVWSRDVEFGGVLLSFWYVTDGTPVTWTSELDNSTLRKVNTALRLRTADVAHVLWLPWIHSIQTKMPIPPLSMSIEDYADDDAL